MKAIKGKGGFAAPGDYVHFKSVVPLHKIPVGSKQWRYYDFGPKTIPPLICIPGIAGSADVFYKQIMALSMKGYRVISVDIPRVWNNHEWVHAFEKFLDAINVHHIHIYGTALGGFLAQLFAQHRPRRVKSLLLSNTFLDTRSFSAAMPWAPVVSWTPSFLLKRYVLTGIRGGPHEPFIADSVDFVVSQVEALSKDDLASRLTLTVDSAQIGPLLLPDASITLMDTNDYCAIPQQLKDEVGERYPGARRASLKNGGDFPFLSRPDEVNLHLQLHLRRVGVEAKLELVRGAPRTVDVRNSHEDDEREYDDFWPRGDEGSSSVPPQNELIYDDDADGPPPKDDEIVEGPSNSGKQEVIDLPIADEDSCRGPLRGNEREDRDDPPEDDGGNSRGPLNSNSVDKTKDHPQDNSGSSGETKSSGSKDADDTPKDSEGSAVSPDPENAISCSLNKQHPGNIVKYLFFLLHQDPQKLIAAEMFLELSPDFLLLYVLSTYMVALYITCSVHFCKSRVLGCVIV